MPSTINLTTKLWPGRSQALRENRLLLSDSMMAQQAAFCSPLDSQISAALTPHHRCFLSQRMMVDRDAQLVKERRISDPGVVSPKWDIYSTCSFSKSSVCIMGEEAEGLKLRKTTAK